MSNQDIRTWAKAQGLNVAEKGPIPVAVMGLVPVIVVTLPPPDGGVY